MTQSPDQPAAFHWTQGARERQEDSCKLVDLGSTAWGEGAILLVVADGMGGQAAGNVASQTAVDVFARTVRRAEGSAARALKDGLDTANDALRDMVKEDPDLEGMGTTLVGVLILGNEAHWISVGDSMLYLLRKGKMSRLNADHSLAGLYAEMAARGEISKEEAASRGGSNQLRSALMGKKMELIDQSPADEPLALRKDDVLILASDGLETLEDNKIRSIAHKARPSPGDIANRLIEAITAVNAPGQDNTTVVAYTHQANSSTGVGGRGDSRKGKRHSLSGGALMLALLSVFAVVLGLGAAGYAFMQTERGGEMAQPLLTLFASEEEPPTESAVEKDGSIEETDADEPVN